MRQKYEEHVEKNPDSHSPRLCYDYACLLICSPSRTEVRQGVELLDLLLQAGFQRPDVLNHLVLTHLKLGQYVCAKEHVDLWLRLEPRDNMARMLHSLVLD